MIRFIRPPKCKEELSELVLIASYLAGFNVIVNVFVLCSTFACKSSFRNGWSRLWNCLGMVRL
jgi:hypothetical protein